MAEWKMGGRDLPPPYSPLEESNDGFVAEGDGIGNSENDHHSAVNPGCHPQTGYIGQQQSHFQQIIVMTQPSASSTVVNSVPNNMPLAILVTFLCCWPLGLVAIMRAQESQRCLHSGDVAGARKFSQESRQFSLAAIVSGCILIVAIIMFSLFSNGLL